MVILILLIIIIAYALGCIPVPRLVCSLLFRKAEGSGAEVRSYPQVLKAYGWAGVGAVFAADLLRSLVIILIGGLLLKGAGFPGVGRRTALLFALLGQMMPIMDGMRARQGLVFPGLLLLWTDWRLFLIALVIFVIVYLLTKRFSLCALGAGVSYPLFSIILGTGGSAKWIHFVLALLAAAVLILPYRGSLVKYFSGLKKGKKKAEEEE